MTGPKRTPKALAVAREALRQSEEVNRIQQARVSHLATQVEALRTTLTSKIMGTLEDSKMDDLQLIGPAELGKLLGRSTMMIKVDVSRRPLTLPPRFVVPGMKKVLWRRIDVREWMDALADIEADRRAAQVQFAKKHGLPVHQSRPINIGLRERGEAATKRMLENRRKDGK